MAQALRAGLRNGGIRRGGLRPGLGNGSLFAVAPLDLFFARNRTLDPRVTFTRASSGTYVRSDGVLRTATTNEPRFDHSPTTGESLGLLVEEQRTNSIRNNTMVGAVAGTPGTLPTNWSSGGATGLTVSVVGTGIENGISYIDIRYNGTTGGTFATVFPEVSSQVAAVNGQNWSLSLYTRLVAGSLSGITLFAAVRQQDSGGVTLADISATGISPTSLLKRTVGAVTLNNASTAFVRPLIGFAWSAGVAIDITVRIGLPQLEQGAFATSVIPTTGTTATRNADVASITGSNFSSWYRQDEGTVFADVNSAPVNNIAQLTFDISEGVGNERMFQRRNTAGIIAAAVVDNGVTQGDIGSVVIGASARYRSGFAYKLNDLEIVVNGGGSATDTSATMPTPDRLHIGQNYASGQSCNGTLRRLTFWSQRLPSSTLQAITQ